MRKRKKGSTLITVLALSIVFMALGGVILTAIMGTMKSNTNQKIREDLKYAAESGLEIARSYFEKNGRSTIENDTNKIEVLLEMLKSNVINDVDIEININETTKKMKVKSIAKGQKEKSEIACEYSIGNGKGFEDIFDYSIVAGQGDVEIFNCYRPWCEKGICENYKQHCLEHCIGQHPKPVYDSSAISSNQGTSINGENIVADGSIIKENQYSEVNFITKMKEIEYVKMEVAVGTKNFHEGNNVKFKDINNNEIVPTEIRVELDNSFKVKENGIWKDSKEENLSQIEPIILMEIMEKKDNINSSILVMMINSKKVDMEMGEGAIDLVEQISIIKGELIISGKGSLKLSSSTIFSASISAMAGYSFDIAYQSNRFIKDKDRLNTILQNIIPNWSSGGSGASGDSLKFENDSFSS